MPIFAMLMMGWTSYFLITWRQEQSQAAMKWGTAGIEEEESARPLFEGETIISPITGANDFLYFPDSEKKKLEARAFVSYKWTILRIFPSCFCLSTLVLQMFLLSLLVCYLPFLLLYFPILRLSNLYF